MSGSNLAPWLLACLLAGFAAAAPAQDLGKLTRKVRVVKKALPGQQAEEMREKEPVKVRMQVETGKDSGASFAIGRTQGAVTMGPESRFRFKEGRFDPAGLLTHMDFEIEWGKFRFVFAPRIKGPTQLGNLPGEVVIKTPTRSIHLYGTDVYLSVDRDGNTTVYVAEGAADVGELGEAVRVEAGEWTTFGPGQPPQPPARVDSDPTKSIFRGGAPEIPGPVLLEVDSPRLDLPKSRLP